MTGDYARLVSTFEEFANGWEKCAPALGAGASRRSVAEYSALAIGPEVVEAMRRRVIMVLATSLERRVSFQYRETAWPLTPQNSCNLGFAISACGYAIVYSNGCECLASYHKDPDNFYLLIVGRNGRYRPVKGKPYLNGKGEAFKLKDSSGYLMKVERHPDWPTSIVLGRLTSNYWGQLYALGSTADQWILASGKCRELNDKNLAVATDCFHGFCGAQLFTSSGAVVGLGASITFEGRDQAGAPTRAYGISYFDRLDYLLADAPDEVRRAVRMVDI